MIRPEWLQPAADGPPCGPNLEYDQDYLDLVVAVRGEPERQYGDTVIPAEEPVWTEIVGRASALLDRSRDVRFVHILTRALTQTEGLAGLRDGLTLTCDILDAFWDSVYPLLEVDGEADPLYRANAVGQFADSDGLVSDVRAARILRSAAGDVTVRDLVRALDSAADPATLKYSRDQVSAAIRDAIIADAAALAEAGDCIKLLDRSRGILAKHLDSMQVPDFIPLRSVLKTTADFIGAIRREVVGVSDADAAAAGGAPPSGTVSVGEIRTRDDAVRVLDRVCEFLARNEPTNPAPLLIRRAQRLMTMPFLDIIRELAPEAAGQVQNITGAPQS